MKIGSVRISKQKQDEALQIDTPKEAGCEQWFIDKITGSKAERRGGQPSKLKTNGKVAPTWQMFDDHGHSIPAICAPLGSLVLRCIGT